MQRLPAFLKEHCTDADVARIIEGLMVACKDISYRLHLGALSGVMGSAEQENVQGECQKKLDVISNDLIKECLAAMPEVLGLASEEEPDPVARRDSAPLECMSKGLRIAEQFAIGEGAAEKIQQRRIGAGLHRPREHGGQRQRFERGVPRHRMMVR